MLLQARPNINGNCPEDFKKLGLQIEASAKFLHQTLVEGREVLHGRNYQTGQVPFSRDCDVERHEKYVHALIAIRQYAAELVLAAEGKLDT